MTDHGHAETTARAVRDLLPAARRDRSYGVSLGLLAFSATAYVLTFVGTFWLDAIVLNLACCLANGIVIGMLFLIGHDACHGSFTPSAALNRLLARAVFLPSLQPYSSWAYTHNGLHHGWTSLKGKDPIFVPFSVAEFNALSWQRRLRERLYRTPPGVCLMHLIEVWWKLEMFPARHHAPKGGALFCFDRLLVLAFLIAEAGVAVLLSFDAVANPIYAVVRTFLFLGLIYAAWFWLIGFVTFQQHTHPDVPWYDDPTEWSFLRGQVHAAPHLHFPYWMRKLLCHVMDHTAHHVDPLIPMYHLPASQRQLDEALGADLVTGVWSISAYHRIFRVCRLYDYARHQWLDFDGTPTSRSGLNQLATLANTSHAA